MSWTPTDMPDLHGHTVVVTGGNAGLGYEIASALAARGAAVVLACRNTDRAEEAVRKIRRRVSDAQVHARTLDLADLTSVAAFAEELRKDHDRLDILVNNAGLMAIDEARTTSGFEMQFGVNHLGHFALTAHLMPLLLNTPGSRVGTMSSINHRTARTAFEADDAPYQRMPAYARSKLANLLFSAELQRRLAAAGASTSSVAAHPGVAGTGLGTDGTGVMNRLLRATPSWLLQGAAAGARPMLRAVTDPTVLGGQYYGPRFRFYGAPVLETPSKAARDESAARRLWQLSAELAEVEPVIAA
jgi:protochlorophyllide reductase